MQLNRMNIVEQLLDWKADGIITDCMYPAFDSECVKLTRMYRPECGEAAGATERSANGPEIPQAACACMSAGTPGQTAPLSGVPRWYTLDLVCIVLYRIVHTTTIEIVTTTGGSRSSRR